MTTREFLELLSANGGKSLIFEYGPGQRVGANYHITEVKNVTVDAVDCGGRSDAWNETVVQLWESPAELDKTEFMGTAKAASIMARVDGIKPIDRDAEIRFEYGNAVFHTAQLAVGAHSADGDRLTIYLGSVATDCKAKSDCGVEASPKTEAVAAMAAEEAEGCCGPASNCC